MTDSASKTLTDLYQPDPTAKGQWWHFVAALKAQDGREFGVQYTAFKFGALEFCHCAVTDVEKQKHFRTELDCLYYGDDVTDAEEDCYLLLFDSEAEVGLVDLVFSSTKELADYPSQTSKHFGNSRMDVTGFIGEIEVWGVGCFDREIFDRLLLPGENGWTWIVAWFDNGETDLFYKVEGEDCARLRLNAPTSYLIRSLPEIKQAWPRTDHSVGYVEQLSGIYEGDKRIGTAYIEVVGSDGVPNL